MGKIDWNKVAEDYKNSSFDRERLLRYAQKAAESLNHNGILFDGYTDDGRPKKGRIKSVFYSLFGSSGEKEELDSQHIGYWELEASGEEYHNGYRDTFLFKEFRAKGDTGFCGNAVVKKVKWVLLSDGRLALCKYSQLYKEYPCVSGAIHLEILRETGSSFLSVLSRDEKCDVKITNEWRLLTEEEILLLDHKKRNVKRRWVNWDRYDIEDSECIRTDNYLLTGKKGGGCSKKITALLKKHGM